MYRSRPGSKTGEYESGSVNISVHGEYYMIMRNQRKILVPFLVVFGFILRLTSR